MPQENGSQKGSHQEVEALMAELHNQFGSREPTPQLQALMRDLQQHVHGVGEPDVDRLSLVESLEVAVEDLEAEHPRTAGVMREIVNVLRNIGV